MLKAGIGALVTIQVATPFVFYMLARRYIYQIETKDGETYAIQHLSPLMWTTKITLIKSEDIYFPPNNEMLYSFTTNNQNGKKFLWDRAFISDTGRFLLSSLTKFKNKYSNSQLIFCENEIFTNKNPQKTMKCSLVDLTASTMKI